MVLLGCFYKIFLGGTEAPLILQVHQWLPNHAYNQLNTAVSTPDCLATKPSGAQQELGDFRKNKLGGRTSLPGPHRQPGKLARINEQERYPNARNTVLQSLGIRSRGQYPGKRQKQLHLFPRTEWLQQILTGSSVVLRDSFVFGMF